MTTAERCVEYLTSRGMLDNDAAAVLEATKPDLRLRDYEMSWERPADEYPDAIYNVIALYLNKRALEFIDASCPQAWFRPMFAS